MNSFITFLKIKGSLSFNSFVFHFRQLPLLKKMISKTIFKNNIERIVWIIVNAIFRLIKMFFSNLLYFMLISFGAYTFLNEFSIDFSSDIFIQTYELLFLGSSVVFGSFKENIASPTVDNYYVIKLMKGDCKKYLEFEFLFLYLTKLVFLIPFMIYMAKFTKTSVAITSMMVGSWILMRLFSYCWELFISKFKHYQVIYIVTLLVSFAIVLGCAGLILAKNTFYIDWRIIIVACTFLAFIGLLLIRNFNYSNLAIKRFNLNSLVRPENVEAEISKQSVKISDKDFKVNSRVWDKKGFIFFNDIFMARHRRLLLKPVAIFSGCIAIVIVVVLVVAFLSFKTIEPIGNGLLERIGALFFVLYFVNRGENYTNALFFNCDVSMLRYSFFRTPKNTLTNFWIRFRNLVILNMIPSILLVILVLILFAFSGIEFFYMFMYSIQILEISLLFSIHYLFVYTMFQPYTENLEQKSYFARFANSFLYFVFFALQDVKLQIFPSFIVVTIITVLYAIIGSLLIMKYASKRFRLR